MKRSGLPVTFGYEPKPGVINVIHGQVARGLLNPSDFREYYIVGIRADFRPFPFGQFEVVQNKQTAGGRKIYMPHLPQPGLIPRDPARTGITNVCFSGRLQNSIDLESLKRDCKALGCEIVFRGYGEWHDMREVDVLLGIRSFDKNLYHSKPPTKLFNAWLAGIPFIGGYDSAYSQVGKPGEDYFRVSSYSELLEALKRLKNEPDLFQSMVQRGNGLAELYTAEKTVEEWTRFFGEEVNPSFQRWKEAGSNGGVRALVSGFHFSFARALKKIVKR